MKGSAENSKIKFKSPIFVKAIQVMKALRKPMNVKAIVKSYSPSLKTPQSTAGKCAAVMKWKIKTGYMRKNSWKKKMKNEGKTKN